MKKRILTMLTVLMVSAGIMAGCSQKTQQESVSELKGTLDEIKDFMFIVTDDDQTSYAFSFEEKPQGLDRVAVGEQVIVKYTGTISEVDPFEGEVLSIEKQP